MLADTVRAWAAGWAVSRRTPPPVEQPWGLSIEVADNPAEVGRHVLPVADESLVRSAVRSVTVPRTWMKMPAEPADVEPWLSPGWAVAWEDTGHLMAVDLAAPDLIAPDLTATDLAATDLIAPEGYTLTVRPVDGVVYVRVLDAVGETAARGQLAVVGETAMVDRVVTAEGHRRKGLGGLVMRSLANQAVELGAETGVLAATDAGRALYETLGWKKHATIAACIYRR